MVSTLLRPRISGFVQSVIAVLVYAIAYYVPYFLRKGVITFDGESWRNGFETYAVYSGIGFIVIGVLVFLIVLLLCFIVRLTKLRITVPALILLSGLWSAGAGYQFLYREKLYTDLARGVVGYMGAPLFVSGIALSLLAVAFIILSFFPRRLTA